MSYGLAALLHLLKIVNILLLMYFYSPEKHFTLVYKMCYTTNVALTKTYLGTVQINISTQRTDFHIY